MQCTLVCLESDIVAFMMASDPTVQVPQRVPHIPRSIRITARQISDISHSRRMGVRREIRKDGSKDVGEALATLSKFDNSLARAATMEEIDIAHQARSKTRSLLRSFEASRRRLKDLHTQRLRTDRAWAKIGAAERSRIQNHGLKALPCEYTLCEHGYMPFFSMLGTHCFFISHSAGIPTTISHDISRTIVANGDYIRDRWILHTMPETPHCADTRKRVLRPSSSVSQGQSRRSSCDARWRCWHSNGLARQGTRTKRRKATETRAHEALPGHSNERVQFIPNVHLLFSQGATGSLSKNEAREREDSTRAWSSRMCES